MTLTRDQRNLPGPVLERLAAAGVLDQSPWSAVQRGRRLEARPSAELRVGTDSPSPRLVGYATSWERPYPVYGGASSGWGWDEVMAAGSWDKTLRERDDIRLLVNHAGIPLARYRTEDRSTMTLTADDAGLLVDADLDVESPLVQTLRSALHRGDLDQMSCAFQVTRQTWSPDYTERRILEVIGFDVAVVTYPANTDTLAVMASSSAAPAQRTLSVALATAHLRAIDPHG